MPSFSKGQLVKIPCEVQPGAFPEENLITVNTGTAVISGFVRSEFLIDQKYVKGTIIGVQGNTLIVQIPGSFFTTASGRANISQDWADNHFERLTA